MRLRARDRAALRCALCHERLGDLFLACPDCSTYVHGDCQEELDACPTLGCGSLRPWRWVDVPRPEPRRAPRRLERVAALAVVAAGVLYAIVVSRAPSVVAAPGTVEPPRVLADPGRVYATPIEVTTSGTPPTLLAVPGRLYATPFPLDDPPPRSAWLAVPAGSVLRIQTDDQQSCLRRSTTRTYRVLSNDGESACVLLEPEGGRREWLRFDRRSVDRDAEGDVLEDRPSTLRVRRGVHVECRYRKLRGARDGQPVTIETWTGDELPLPLLTIVTWEGRERRETTRVARQP